MMSKNEFMAEIKVEEYSHNLICLHGGHFVAPDLLLLFQRYRIWDHVSEFNVLGSQKNPILEKFSVKLSTCII